MLVLSDSLNTKHTIWIATLDFHLNRRVVDTEIGFQLFSDSAQNILTAAHALFVDHHVAATANHTRADGPDMQVVNFQDAMYARNRLLNLVHIHSGRNCL